MTRRWIRIWHYVRDGPEAGGDSPLRRLVGIWLWWRVWAMGAVFIVGFGALAKLVGTSETAMRAWAVGLFTALLAQWVMDDG